MRCAFRNVKCLIAFAPVSLKPQCRTCTSAPSTGGGTNSGGGGGSSDLRGAILKCALTHVHTLGWSNEAIVQGTIDAGASLPCHGVTLRGPVELVEFFLCQRINVAVEALSTSTDRPSPTNNTERPLSPQSAIIVSMAGHSVDETAQYAASWPQALSLLLEPRNAIYSLGLLTQHAGVYCREAGLTASRMDWYFERATIASLILSTGTNI